MQTTMSVSPLALDFVQLLACSAPVRRPAKHRRHSMRVVCPVLVGARSDVATRGRPAAARLPRLALVRPAGSTRLATRRRCRRWSRLLLVLLPAVVLPDPGLRRNLRLFVLVAITSRLVRGIVRRRGFALRSGQSARSHGVV